jgi:hypothetical protein
MLVNHATINNFLWVIHSWKNKTQIDINEKNISRFISCCCFFFIKTKAERVYDYEKEKHWEQIAKNLAAWLWKLIILLFQSALKEEWIYNKYKKKLNKNEMVR